MISIKNILLLLFAFLFYGFVTCASEDEVNFQVIDEGKTDARNLNGQLAFTIQNIFDYDEFWIRHTGNTTNKPYVDLDGSTLIVFGGTGKIDKITFSEESITIYTSSKPAYARETGFTFPVVDLSAYYRLIKVPRNSNPVKWVHHVIASETNED